MPLPEVGATGDGSTSDADAGACMPVLLKNPQVGRSFLLTHLEPGEECRNLRLHVSGLIDISTLSAVDTLCILGETSARQSSAGGQVTVVNIERSFGLVAAGVRSLPAKGSHPNTLLRSLELVARMAGSDSRLLQSEAAASGIGLAQGVFGRLPHRFRRRRPRLTAD